MVTVGTLIFYIVIVSAIQDFGSRSGEDLNLLRSLCRACALVVVAGRHSRVSFFLHSMFDDVSDNEDAEFGHDSSEKSRAERAVEILQRLEQLPTLRGAQTLEIEWISRMISTNQLYVNDQLDDREKIKDEETREWLQQYVGGRHKRNSGEGSKGTSAKRQKEGAAESAAGEGESGITTSPLSPPRPSSPGSASPPPMTISPPSDMIDGISGSGGGILPLPKVRRSQERRRHHHLLALDHFLSTRRNPA